MRVFTLASLMLLFLLSCLLSPARAEGTDYARLLRQMAKPDQGTYQVNWEVLRYDTDPRAEAALRVGLKDKTPMVRAHCIHLLLERRVPDGLTLAQAALRDKAPEVWHATLFALQVNPDPAAFDWLVSLLRDPRVDVRSSAARALGAYGSVSEAPLLTALYDDSSRVRMTVIEALAKCGGGATVTAIAELLKTETHAYTRSLAGETLGRIGSPAVETLSRLAVDPDAKIRAPAVSSLRRINDPRVRPLLEAALRDPDPQVRSAALPGLMRDPEYALPLLYAALRDSDPQVRREALNLLYHAHLDERAIEPLIALLDDTDAEVRAMAASRLGGFRSSRVTEALLDRLRRPDCPYAVMQALGTRRETRAIPELIARLTPPAQIEENGQIIDLDEFSLIELMGNPCAEAYSALYAIGEPSIAPLVEAAASADPRARRRALETLGAFDDPRAVQVLLAAADDTNKVIRLAALRSLGELGDECRYAVLIPALDDPDRKVRVTAASALEGCQDARIIKPLAHMLHSRDGMEREVAVRTLSEMDDPRVVPLCMMALRDRSEEVLSAVFWGDGAWARDPRAVKAFIRMAIDGGDLSQDAIEQLGSLPTELAVPALLRVLRSPKRDVRRAAIGEIEEHHDQQVSHSLLTLLADADLMVRGRAEAALTDWCAPEEIPSLHALLGQTRHQEARLAAIRILAKLEDAETLRAVPIDSVSHRPTLLRMVAVTKDARALPLLLEALRDPNPSVREEAIQGMVTLGDTRAVPVLLEALHDKGMTQHRNAIVGTLGAIKDPASVEPLIALLSDPQLRTACAWALGKIGDKRAVEPLLALLPTTVSRAAYGDFSFHAEVSALIQLGDHRVADRLPALLDSWWTYRSEGDGNLSQVRDTCLRALGKLRDPRAIAHCEKTLHDDMGDRAAIDALVNIGGDRAVDVLLNAVDVPVGHGYWAWQYIADALSTITAEHLQEKLTAAATNPRWRVRLVAVRALAGRSEAWAGPLLAAAVHDPQLRVSRAAREAGRL